MAKRNPRPTDIPNWISDDTSGIVAPSGAKQNTGWLVTEKPPAQFFNWFWNRLTQIIDYVLPRADKYNIIIDTDVNEGDYDTLTAYLADAPVSGDRVLIKVDETLVAQTIIPAGITLHQLAGKKFSCATNIATSIFQFGDNVVIEGPFILETTQAGVTAITFELNGDNNYLENLVLENSGAGTITNAFNINANKESNYTRGSTDNTGAGSITNIITNNSTVNTNDVIIRSTGDIIYVSSIPIHDHSDLDNGGLALADSIVDQGGGSNLKCKVIEIGDWNMNLTSEVTVTHGLTLSKIRQVTGVIRNDDGSFIFTITPGSNVTVVNELFFKRIVSTDILIARKTGGDFDNDLDYDATSYNRGWVMIWHTE